MSCTLEILSKDLPSLVVKGAEYSEYRIFQQGIRCVKRVPIGQRLIEIGAKPSGLPWVTFEIYSEEPLPTVEYKGQQHIASFTLALKNGVYDVPLYDPSVRDNNNNYQKLGSMKIKVTMCFNFADYVKELDKSKDVLFSSAREEQEDAVAVWVRDFKPRIIHKGVQWFFLQRFTLKWHNLMVPSWYFVEMAQFLPAASTKFINYMYEKVTEIHGVSMADVENWMTKKAPSDYELYVCHRILADMVTLPAVANVYNGDHAGADMVERFSMACYQRLNNGDCEDLAKVIFATFWTFRKNERLSPALRLLFDSFECLLCTGAASYKSLTLSMNSSDFICHVWAMLIPNDLMNTWLGANKYKPSRLAGRLYPIMGEGTNFAEGLSQKIGFYIKDSSAEVEIERIKTSQRLYDRVTNQFPQLKDKISIRFNALENDPPTPSELSSFYRYLLTAWFKGGEGAYHFEKNGKVGIYIHDALRGDPSVTLVKHASKQILQEDDRKVLLASETQPEPLTRFDSYVDSSKGKIDRNNMVEFRFQSLNEIKGLDLNMLPSYKLITVRITEDVQVYVLQVSL